MKWLDPAAPSRLRALGFSPRRAARGSAAPGRHRAFSRGHSRDFAHHRAYAPGDEIRAVDWRAYARLDRWFVREYRAEDRIPVSIVLDATGSMAFAAGGRPAKFDAARRLAASLCWLALAQGDEAGLVLAGEKTRELAPPRAGLARLAALDAALDAVRAEADLPLGAALFDAAALVPRRGVCVLISDLMGDAAEILKGARALASRRDLLVLRVLDPDERDFPYDGPLLAEGFEGGAPLALDASAAEAYRAAFARQAEAYTGAFRHAGVPYAVAENGGDAVAAAARLLAAA